MTTFAYLITTAIAGSEQDEQAQPVATPVFTIIGLLTVIVIWPRIIPLNAVFLALTAFALGLPVLRHELFNPLANAHAEPLRKNRELGG